MRVIRGIFWCATILLAVSVGAIAVLSTQDLRFASSHVERLVSARLNQNISIRGPIRAALLPEGVRVSLSDVAIDNVDWGLEPYAARAGKLVADIPYSSLFKKGLSADRLRMKRATVYVERGMNETVNWSELLAPGGNLNTPERLEFENVEVQSYDLSGSGLTRVAVRKLYTSKTVDGLSYDGWIRIAGQPLEFSGTVQALSRWQEEKAAAVRTTGSYAGFEFSMKGPLRHPAHGNSTLLVRAAREGDGAQDAYTQAGLPDLLDAHLTLTENGFDIAVEAAEEGADTSGLTGSVSVDWTPFERPLLAARLDFDRLAIPDPADRDQTVALADLLPTIRRTLRNWDANLVVAVDRIRMGGATIESAEIYVDAHGGQVPLGYLDLDLAGGHVEVPFQAWFDPVFSVAFRPHIRDVRLERLPALGDVSVPLSGKLNVAADIKAEGDTGADLLASLTGQTNLLIGTGAMATNVADQLGEGAWSEIWQLFSHGRWNREVSEQEMGLSCVLSRFDFEGGLATANGFLVETHQAATTGTGVIDFRDNKIDFRLSPRPKDPALLASAADLRVGGKLDAPTLSPQRNVAPERRGAGGVGTLVLSGGAQSLLPLLDIDHDGGSVCASQFSGSFSDASSVDDLTAADVGG